MPLAEQCKDWVVVVAVLEHPAPHLGHIAHPQLDHAVGPQPRRHAGEPDAVRKAGEAPAQLGRERFEHLEAAAHAPIRRGAVDPLHREAGSDCRCQRLVPVHQRGVGGIGSDERVLARNHGVCQPRFKRDGGRASVGGAGVGAGGGAALRNRWHGELGRSQDRLDAELPARRARECEHRWHRRRVVIPEKHGESVARDKLRGRGDSPVWLRGLQRLEVSCHCLERRLVCPPCVGPLPKEVGVRPEVERTEPCEMCVHCVDSFRHALMLWRRRARVCVWSDRPSAHSLRTSAVIQRHGLNRGHHPAFCVLSWRTVVQECWSVDVNVTCGRVLVAGPQRPCCHCMVRCIGWHHALSHYQW
eukprot:m.419022 g.419022  ORF g.419022 m.419022 type:complete len:358 (+) comp31265_c0_seq1:2733-3806(+)